MTNPKEKAPNLAEKRDTLRLRATRLDWHRVPTAALHDAALGQATAHSPEAPSTEADVERRLTVVTRLRFVPHTLEAYARRLKWRQRMPIVLCVALFVVLALWLVRPIRSDAGTTGATEGARPPIATPGVQTTEHSERLSAEKPIAMPAVSAPPAVLPPPEVPSALPSTRRQQLERKAPTPELKPSRKPAQPSKPSPSPDDDWL